MVILSTTITHGYIITTHGQILQNSSENHGKLETENAYFMLAQSQHLVSTRCDQC